jgi:hypothetical protein
VTSFKRKQERKRPLLIRVLGGRSASWFVHLTFLDAFSDRPFAISRSGFCVMGRTSRNEHSRLAFCT